MSGRTKKLFVKTHKIFKRAKTIFKASFAKGVFYEDYKYNSIRFGNSRGARLAGSRDIRGGFSSLNIRLVKRIFAHYILRGRACGAVYDILYFCLQSLQGHRIKIKNK